MEALVAQADIYVSIAESDGVSLSLLEAMSLGAVPVVSDIAANTDWIRDGRGGVVTDIDPVAVADAIERAAALDADEARSINRSMVGERGDYMTNMGLAELVLDDVAGVRFERGEGARARDDEDAA